MSLTSVLPGVFVPLVLIVLVVVIVVILVRYSHSARKHHTLTHTRTDSVCLSICLSLSLSVSRSPLLSSLSLSHTHTHTNTHTHTHEANLTGTVEARKKIHKVFMQPKRSANKMIETVCSPSHSIDLLQECDGVGVGAFSHEFHLFCRRYKLKRAKNVDKSDPQDSSTDQHYSDAASVDKSEVFTAEPRPESYPYNSVVLPAYAQVDKTRKTPEHLSNGVPGGGGRVNSELIMHENNVYKSAPIRGRKESGPDSDEIFEENEVYASSVDLTADETDDDDHDAAMETENASPYVNVDVNHNRETTGYYNLPRQKSVDA